jgi:hypothetical protein
MAIKYINIFQSEVPKFFSQIGIFGLKANHVATLIAVVCVSAVANGSLLVRDISNWER